MINPLTRPYLPEELEALELEIRIKNKVVPGIVFKNDILEIPQLDKLPENPLPVYSD